MRQKFDPDAILHELGRRGEAGRSFDMRIDRRGDWYHEGRRVARIPLVKLFASVLRRDTDGGYWLVTPVEQGRIEVEDVPFTLVEMVLVGEGPEQVLRLRSNLDEWAEASATNPLVMRAQPDGKGEAPYLVVRDGLEGRVERAVLYETVDAAEERDGRLGIWSGGCFHELGTP